MYVCIHIHVSPNWLCRYTYIHTCLNTVHKSVAISPQTSCTHRCAYTYIYLYICVNGIQKRLNIFFSNQLLTYMRYTDNLHTHMYSATNLHTYMHSTNNVLTCMHSTNNLHTYTREYTHSHLLQQRTRMPDNRVVLFFSRVRLLWRGVILCVCIWRGVRHAFISFCQHIL
jgi:hypothetical protein